jgi:tetratricopeptide (TPR) repeat protein
MALDVYAPCPCGSGKKLKFCCLNIADEMDRISRLIDNNQLRQALHQLESLRRKHPENPWAATTEALVLIESGESSTARDSLQRYLEKHPEQDFAAVIYATAVLQCDGFDAAKKPIHRAFQRGAKKFPTMVAGLAGAMAAVLQSRGRMFAAREHLALSMKFAPDKARQEIFVRLLEFDNDEVIPYPLRSVHPMPPVAGDEAVTNEFKKAQKYASVGCWDTAADVLSKLAESLPESAELQHGIGLCRAWDGNEEQSAAALHRAAQLYADRSTATECETLAQLLDWNTTSSRKTNLRWPGTISSVGRLLTLLDAVPQLVRLEMPPKTPEGEELPQAMYQVLDRPLSDCPPAAQLTRDTMPNVVAQVFVDDADPHTNEPAEVNVVGLSGSAFDRAAAIVREASGDTVTWAAAAEDTGQWVPEESLALQWQWAYPPQTPVAVRRRLEREQWRHVTDQVWPNLSLQGLQGRTPLEAANDPASKTALMAAVYVLDSQCLRGGFDLDVNAIFGRLGLESLPPVNVTPETALNAFTPLQWLRLPLTQLTDGQMLSAVNRALLVHHDRFLYDALKAAVERPKCLEELDQARVYQTLADLCRKHDRREEVFHWLDRGRQYAQTQQHSFEQVWSWDFKELLARLEDPTDPAIQPLLHKFATYYAPKLPQLRPHLEEILAVAGVESPWSSGLVTSAAEMPTGGLWTPGAAAEPAAAGKLWLPGQ